jgi:chromosome segregation ATPase
MEKSGGRTARNTKGIIVLAKRIVKVERKLDLVIAEMLNRDEKRLEELKRAAGGMRKEFDRVYVAIQHLSEEFAKASRAPAAEAEAVAQMKSVVDKLRKDGALFQTRYQVLLRENEALKSKVRELSYKQNDKTEELPRRAGGLRSIFKRG